MATLQVRNLSPATHQALKVRAAQSGQSLSAYVAKELDRHVSTPSLEEFYERVRLRGDVEPSLSSVDVLELERTARLTSLRRPRPRCR